MTKSKFKLYSVLKNEDAVPFVGDNVLVVADGLGGSGSTVHKIDRTIHSDMRNEILFGVFGDIAQMSSEFRQYIEELLTPMTDEIDDTSALWASRIVIARCVYALTEGEFKNANLKDEKNRAKLARFITNGLCNVVEKFHLQKGKYACQLLLPTTLSVIRYAEKGDSVIVEVVWAGDSRCYALLPDGLKLLSVDDEDKSGAITNLFHVGKSNVHLKYARYELKKPCILLTVSDGVFDPFAPHEHFGMEHTILSTIAQSNSQEEVADKLKRFYDGVHADDATMACAALGFSDFAELKEVFKPRTELILSVQQKLSKLQRALEVVDLSEEEASYYVVFRVTDRFEQIVAILLEAIEQNQSDIAITDVVRNIVFGVNQKQHLETERVTSCSREQSLRALYQFAKAHPELVNTEILNNTKCEFRNDEFDNAVLRLRKAAFDWVVQYARIAELQAAERQLEEQKQRLYNKTHARIETIRKEFDRLWCEKNSVEVAKKRSDVSEMLVTWYRLENSLKFSWGVQNIGKLYSEDRQLAWEISDYVVENKNLSSNLKTHLRIIDECAAKYLQALNSFFRWVVDFPDCESILSENIRRKFGLISQPPVISASSAANVTRDKAIQMLREQKTAVVSSIVNALAQHYDKTSIIDSKFNSGKLSLFRTYYQQKHHPDNEVRAFSEQFAALEIGYTSLVKQYLK